jgi:hypothetical protein
MASAVLLVYVNGGEAMSLELRPQTGLLFIPKDMTMENHGGMILTGENKDLEEKTVPVPLSPTQIQHRLTRARTRASAVTGQRLTA